MLSYFFLLCILKSKLRHYISVGNLTLDFVLNVLYTLYTNSIKSWHELSNCTKCSSSVLKTVKIKTS